MSNNRSKLNPHSPILPLLIVVIIIGLGYFVISPLITQLKEINILAGAKDRQNVQMQDKINDLNYLKVEFAKSTEELELLEVVIPQDLQMPEIVVQLVEIANKSGLEISSISPKITKNQSYIIVNTKGDFNSTTAFVDNLEKNIRPIKIGAIDFSTSQTKEGISSLTASITLEVFSLNSN